MDHDPETDSYTCKNGKKQSSTRKPALAFTLVVLLLVGLGFSGYNFLNQDTHSDVPENVIEFGEKYPEAREYVQNFTEYVDKDLDMDVSKEMAASDIPLFIQWDKRWGYRNYGANYVGVAGCGPTCLAMVACGLKNDSELNPFVVATYASNEGFYTYGEGTSWSIMTEGAKHYGLNVVSGDVSSDYILANLSSKAPMICSMAPGDFTKTGHFIVLTGIDADGKIIVNDPNSPKNSSKHWDVDSLVSQMKSVWKYSNA
ncbi:C39 family peptidase [Butyrivibrio sp. INlla16]|uniref:C39 family peptidase n=1 Tax=Butyrivibrio sp. INlla16 TaxID=1520807 RepID=UPI002FE54069